MRRTRNKLRRPAWRSSVARWIWLAAIAGTALYAAGSRARSAPADLRPPGVVKNLRRTDVKVPPRPPDGAPQAPAEPPRR